MTAPTFESLFARGTEFLRGGQVAEAQADLVAALKLTPGDPKALTLLGLTHFRLAEFAEASKVYETLVKTSSDDASHWMNLGLVRLKLGETKAAVAALETSRNLDPSQGRAANYLGLAYARAGRYAAAYEAFVVAGQQELAQEVLPNLTTDERAEVDARLHRNKNAAASDEDGDEDVDAVVVEPPPPPPRKAPTSDEAEPSDSVTFTAVDTTTAKDSPSARSPRIGDNAIPRRRMSGDTAVSLAVAHAIPSEVGSIGRVAPGNRGPVPLSEFATAKLARPDDGDQPFELTPDGVMIIRVNGRIFARTSGVSVRGGSLTYEPAMRRTRGTASSENFDNGIHRLCEIEGQGHLIMAPHGDVFTTVRLDDDILYIRENLIVGFEHDIRWENGSVPGSGGELRMVQFRGAGALALRSKRALYAVLLQPSTQQVVDAEALAGWIGRVVPRINKSSSDLGGATQVVCAGDGVLLLQDIDFAVRSPDAVGEAPVPQVSAPDIAPAEVNAGDLLGDLDSF